MNYNKIVGKEIPTGKLVTVMFMPENDDGFIAKLVEDKRYKAIYEDNPSNGIDSVDNKLIAIMAVEEDGK